MDFATGLLVIIMTSENSNSEYWVSESLQKIKGVVFYENSFSSDRFSNK